MKAKRPLALVVALAILVAGGALTAWTVRLQDQAMQHAAALRFEHEVDRIAEQVTHRFETPMLGLRALQGLYAASDDVSRSEFDRFIANSGMAPDIPGVRGFGYIARVPAEGLQAYARALRHDGLPNYQPPPSGPGRFHDLVTYTHPATAGAPEPGTDLAAQPAWLATAEHAATLGLTRLTPPATGSPADSAPNLMLALAPIYRHEANQAPQQIGLKHLQGWAFAPISAADLLASVISENANVAEFALTRLSAGDGQSLPVYAPAGWNPATADAQSLRTRRRLNLAGQSLELEARSIHTTASAAYDVADDLVAPAGSLLSLALASVSWLLITGRSRARAAAVRMTEDLARLAQAVRLTTNAVLILDPAARITWVNEGFTRMYGYLPEESIGRTPADLLGALGSDPAALRSLVEAVRLHHPCRVEVQNQTKDGRLLWIETELQPTYDPQGRHLGFIELALDITTQKDTAQRLQAALHENEGLLNTIRQHAVLSVADAQGLIVDVNDAFCQISQHPREALLGRKHSLLNSGVQTAGFWAAMWGTIAAGQPWRGQVCNRARDGSLYWLDSIIAPVRGSDGHIERYVSIASDITASKRAEQALRDSQQFLDRVGRMAGVGGWWLNLNQGSARLTLADEVRRQLDLPGSGAMSERAFLRRCDASARWQLLMAVRTALRHGQNWDVELPVQDAHGGTRWLRIVGEVGLAGDGTRTHLVGAAQDVTRRRELEAGVRRTNGLLTGVVQNLPCGLAVFDAERRLVVQNESFGKLVGIPQEKLARPGLLLDDVVRNGASWRHESVAEIDAVVLDVLQRYGQPSREEKLLRSGLTVEISSSPMPGGGVVRTYVDVSERKRQEAEARRADLLLRTALDTLDEAFVLYDPQDRLVLCNDRYRQIFATSADLIVPGAPFEHIVRIGAQRGQYPEANGRLDEWVAERLAQHRAPSSQSVMQLDSGRWLRVIERRMPDGHTVGFRIDITDLMNANQAARSASEAKSQFLANMSHEIRTPLNAILGMLRLLQRTPLSPRQFDYAGKTESAARALLGLVNDILDFSKIEAGMMVLDPQPFQPRQLLDDLMVLLGAQPRDEDAVTLHIEADPHLPEWLQGDAMRMLQVLINLGGNAIKFTRQGAVQVKVSLAAQDAQDVLLDLSVSDTGIGIAPEHLERIFTGFSQAEASTTRRFGGTGLGLAISRRFVQMMGSELCVDSVPGQGSRFHFQVRLPLAQAPADHAHVARAAERARSALALTTDEPVVRTESVQRLRGLRVLLVEDNANNRQVACELLQDEGADVVSAHHGREGVDVVLATAQRFDAVLMDVQMPVMDGLAATREIRADARFAALPIIAMSANVTTHDRDAALAAGMNDHVGKPFDLNHLVSTLQHWTDWKTSEAAGASLPTLQLPSDLAAAALSRGIDLQSALDRVLGRTAVYHRMLSNFSERNEELKLTLARHMAAHEQDSLQRELHSLKGMAAMLGAIELAALAAQGEAEAGKLDQAWLHTMGTAMDRCVHDLQDLAAQLPGSPGIVHAATAAWPPQDRAALRDLLTRLGAQLAEADMAATDTYEELLAHCEGAPSSVLTPLEAAMARLDFAAAQAHTQALQEQVAP